MSLENNQQDFERCLGVMKDHILLLSQVLDSSIIRDLEDVVSEYEGHLCGDIEDLVTENSELADMVSTLEVERDNLLAIVDDISS